MSGPDPKSVELFIWFLFSSLVVLFAVGSRKWGFVRTSRIALHASLAILSFLIAVSFYLRTYDSVQIKITLFQIGVPTVFFLWLILEAFERKIILSDAQKRILIPAACIFLWSLISFFISPYKAGRQDFWQKLFFLLTFFVVFLGVNRIGRRTIVRCCLAGAAVCALYGVLQILDGLPRTLTILLGYLGLPENVIGYLNSRLPDYTRSNSGWDPFIWQQAFGSRIFSTFGNPGFFAVFLNLMVPLCILLGLRKERSSPLLLFLAGLLIFNILATYTKLHGYVALIISICFLIHLAHRQLREDLSKRGIYILQVLAVFMIPFGFQIIGPSLESHRFRGLTWQATWEMVQRKPILGHGIGSFKFVYPAFRKPEIFHIEKRHNTETDHAESEYLEIWSEEGTIGLVLMLWFLWAVFRSLFLKLKESESGGDERVLLAAFFVSCLSFFITCIYAGVGARFLAPGFYPWLFLGMACGIAFPVRRVRRLSRPSVGRTAVRGLSAVGILFSFWYFPRFFWADVNHNIAIFFSKQGNWIPALQYYNKVLKDNPYYIMSHYFMGNVHNDRGVPYMRMALQKYQDVLSLAPNYVQMHYQIGVVYQKMAEQARQAGNQGKFIESHEKAIESFLRYKKIDPVFFRNYQALGMSYAYLGRWQESVSAYRELILYGGQIFESKNEAWLNLGNIYYMESKDWGDKKKPGEASRSAFAAENSYKKALEISQWRFAQACENLVILYIHRGAMEKAFQTCKKFLKIEPGNQKIRGYLRDIVWKKWKKRPP